MTRFVEESFIAQPDISIDYAVMEKAEKDCHGACRLRLVGCRSWDAVAGAHEADQDGNSAVGVEKIQFIGAANTHVESISHTEKVIAAIGT